MKQQLLLGLMILPELLFGRALSPSQCTARGTACRPVCGRQRVGVARAGAG